MTKLEHYLLDNNYIRLENKKNVLTIGSDDFYYSTMGLGWSFYLHKDIVEKINDFNFKSLCNNDLYKKNVIIIGIDEYPLLPRLMSPRPNIKLIFKCGHEQRIKNPHFTVIDSYLSDFDGAEVVKAMFNKDLFLTKYIEKTFCEFKNVPEGFFEPIEIKLEIDKFYQMKTYLKLKLNLIKNHFLRYILRRY